MIKINICNYCIIEHNDYVELKNLINQYYVKTYLSFGDFAVVLYDMKNNQISSCIIKFDTKTVESFITEKEFRNKGFGELLLSYVIKEYEVDNLIVDRKNLPAKHLYTKFGFKWTGEIIEVKDEIYEIMKII